MLIKICGMKYPENIHETGCLFPDMMGFIFYEKSPRYAGNELKPRHLYNIPKAIRKVGVFVNEKESEVIKKANDYHLDYVQLHGDESLSYCRNLKSKNIPVIKAFLIDEHFNFSVLKSFETCCEYFLFDTKAEGLKGGTGKTFNWEQLSHYCLKTPFLLSGGIGPDNIDTVMTIHHNQLAGIDINSKIETEPGLKSPEKTKLLIEKIRVYAYKTR